MIRILHVEDTAEDAELLQLKLRKFRDDIELVWSSSASDALSHIKKDSFDCILSDYQMPGMDGLELLKKLRGGGADLPFIFFTGQGNEQLAEEAFNNGADDYYTKDAGFAHYNRLINSINRVVESHRTTLYRMRSERALRAILSGTAAETGTAFFRSLVLNLARAAGVRYATIGRKFEGEINTIAFCADDNIEENFTYTFRYAPCNETLKRGLFFVGDSVQEQFPDEASLKELNLRSYCGCRLNSSRSEPLGVLTLLNDKPILDKQFVLSLIRIFASRASAELEREMAVDSLRISQRQYKDVFNSLDDAIVLFDQESLKIVDVNDAFLRLTGYSNEEALALDSTQTSIMPPEETKAFADSLFHKLENGDRVQFKWMLATKSKGHIETAVTLKNFLFEEKKLALAIIKP